ncbi:MAG: hypothetical protein HYU57_07245 [Micavibrio aeruginosavorus]|nr:hypothetical protein [Micavibrio aeruginosavorus]
MTNEVGTGIPPEKSRRWTPELRERQARRTRSQKPWLKSTGPRTESGKARSKMNAAKHGLRSRDYRMICRLLRECRKEIDCAILEAQLELERKKKSGAGPKRGYLLPDQGGRATVRNRDAIGPPPLAPPPAGRVGEEKREGFGVTPPPRPSSCGRAARACKCPRSGRGW